MKVTQPCLTHPFGFRGTGGERSFFCASHCVSVPALTSKPVFTLKLTGLEIFPPKFPAGLLHREQSPSWVVHGRTAAGTCWEGLGSSEEGHVQSSLSARLWHVTHVPPSF